MIEQDGPGAVTLGAGDRALAVAAVKAVLRLVASDEDALVAGFAESALGLAEHFLGQVTIVRDMRDILPVSAAWQRLAARPVGAITAVERLDGGALPADGYAVDIDADGDGWVRVVGAGDATQVAVRFAAGLAADWPGLPAPIRQGVVLLAAHLFDVRDGAAPPPAAVTALWRPFRRMTLREAARC